MGGISSKQRIDKALGSAFPENERVYGLENFGNTCYCNSVLQALYYCKPLRERCIEESLSKQENGDDDLLACLCDLFHSISTQRKRCGVHPPRRFVAKLRAENEVFNNQMHQDAHELLNYLLNEMAEILEKRNKAAAKAKAGSADASGAGAQDDADGDGDGGRSSPAAGSENGGASADGEVSSSGAGGSGSSSKPYIPKTWIHNIFEGLLTNETRCLACDSVTSRDESFLDLSLEIEQNSSVSACMRNFSANESLRGDNKFFCDTCCSLQEAHKRMRIKRLPNVLALHLKRFKYIEQLQRFKKLAYRIAFPIDLKLTNVCDEAVDPDRKYKLFAVIVHAGSGPNHGHYVALVRAHNQWLCFDDDLIEPIEEAQIQAYFGSSLETAGSTETGYLLFYQAEQASWDDAGEREAPA